MWRREASAVNARASPGVSLLQKMLHGVAISSFQMARGTPVH